MHKKSLVSMGVLVLRLKTNSRIVLVEEFI